MERLATASVLIMTTAISALASAVLMALFEPSRPTHLAALSVTLSDLAGAVVVTHPIAALTLGALLIAGMAAILTTLRPRPTPRAAAIHLAGHGLHVRAAQLRLQDLAGTRQG